MTNTAGPGSAAAMAAAEAHLRNELTWRFLGLEVARKTEILALAAFVLSISSAIWQVKNYLAGPVLRVFPSDQVTFTSAKKLGQGYENEPDLVRVSATMSYVNEGETGQNGTIRREKIAFAIGSKKYEHHWYQFVSMDVKDGQPTLKRESEARPFAVTAGGSTSHETLFAPWEAECAPGEKDCSPARNFLTWEGLLREVKAAKEVAVTTTAEVYSKGPVSSTCKIKLRDYEIKALEDEGWLAATCREK
jgi:hypothetical protein